jgi:AcrR family transcriptional regulator
MTQAATEPAATEPATAQPAATEPAAAQPATAEPQHDERDRVGCILAAALELIGEVGYERMTMDGIASRARASKATMYRRWDSKAELVTAAIACRDHGNVPQPDTGDLRTDLVEGVLCYADHLVRGDIDLITGLMSAMRTDEELARLLRSQVFAAKHETTQRWVVAAVARGDVAAASDFDLVHEVVMAVVIQRIALTGEPVDRPFVERLVDVVLLPTLIPPSDA